MLSFALRGGENPCRLEITIATYNHLASPASVHPAHRQEVMRDFDNEITDRLNVGILPRQIIAGFYASGIQWLSATDFYNKKAQMVTDYLGGRSSIQALLHKLPNERKWVLRYQLREDDSLSCLFGMCKVSLRLLKNNPYILGMDCTFKTNRLKVPFLDIVGATSTGISLPFLFSSTSVPITYLLLIIYGTCVLCWLCKSFEPTGGIVTLALRCLREIYEKKSLGDGSPSTIFTDKDIANINAIHDVFPETDSMLCLWHINVNIKKHACPADPIRNRRS